MKYYRPETIEEALELLSEGVPLAGGTALAPERRTLEAVVDLDKLGLDQIEIQSGTVRIGAATRIQRLLDPDLELPAQLRRAARFEASLNLRNMATLGGTIMTADARSPLLLVLLALQASVSISGEASEVPLDKILDDRMTAETPFLIERIAFDLPEDLHYEYVARSPADRPLVSAAAAAPAAGKKYSIAIGGYGERPQMLDPVAGDAVEAASQQAARRYSDAGDAFASAEYRSEVVSILVERVLEEVQS